LFSHFKEMLVYTKMDCKADDDNAIALRVKTSLGGVFSTEYIVSGGYESIDIVAGIHSYDPYISFRSINKYQFKELLKGYRDYTLLAKFIVEYGRRSSLIAINQSSWRSFIAKTLSYQLLGVSTKNIHKDFASSIIGFRDKYAYIARVISKHIPDTPLIGYSTRKGPRERNEDSMLISQITVCSGGKKNVIKLAIVCDGAGGLTHGLEASAIGVLETFAKFLDLFLTVNDIAESMREAVIYANERILNYIKNIRRQVASTIAMIVIYQNLVYYLNIGDTAIDIVLTESGESIRLSRHHRVEMQGRTFLSSYLGHPNPEIHMGIYELREKSHIVISTDGVHEVLKNNMYKILLNSNLPSIAANNLTFEAERLGSRDNMTAIVVSYL